ncbi:MAG: WD40 repeat domain-containing protein [Candidatus Poribacteria bacterium]|nr:WD40 repeat domain-containing protein [Candidatus Poribacteria bacterium]
MKKAMVLKFCLLFLSALCLPHSFAQDSPQWGLPEGAKARIGKGRIGEIQYSPDGTRLAVASSIGIWLYDAATHQEIALLTGHTGFVTSLAFSPNGEILASASRDYTIRLWDADSGNHLQTLTGHGDWVFSVAFSPDGNTIASASGGDRTVRIWDADTGNPLRRLEGHMGEDWSVGAGSVAFSPDGSTIAGASGHDYVRMWEVGTGKHLRILKGHTE